MQTLASGDSSERQKYWWSLGWVSKLSHNLTNFQVTQRENLKHSNIYYLFGRLRHTANAGKIPRWLPETSDPDWLQKMESSRTLSCQQTRIYLIGSATEPLKTSQTFTCDWRNTELTNTSIQDRKIPISPDIGGILRNKNNENDPQVELYNESKFEPIL